MSEHSLIQHSKKWDRTGIVIASLCLIHCLAFPLIIMLLPATQAYLHHSWFEIIVFGSGIIVGSISFFTSYRKHKSKKPLLVGFIGVLLLLWSLIAPTIHTNHSHFSYLTILGGALLITGHIWNIRACACYCDKSCHHNHH